ncbi:MAG: PKD domain-containing protein [Actinomycetota bacterium]
MKPRARFVVALLAITLPLLIQGAGAVPPNGPDAAVSWSPAYPMPNNNVTFSIDTQDSDGSIKSVTMSFGDGASQTINAQRSVISDTKACVLGAHQTFTMTHAYGKTGSFPLTIEVQSSPCPATAPLDSTSSIEHYSMQVYDPKTAEQLTAAH